MFSPKPSVVDHEVVVLDPFAGSATTGIACMELDRHFIGFEIDKETCAAANKRLRAVKKSKEMFG